MIKYVLEKNSMKWNVLKQITLNNRGYDETKNTLEI